MESSSIESISEGGEFQVYRSKKNRRQYYTRLNNLVKPQIQNIDSVYDLADVQYAIEQIQTVIVSVRATKFYEHFRNHLDHLSKELLNDNISSILCFGIGQFSACRIARHQLAVIILLQKHFGVTTIEFHEPVLTKLEVEVLERLNLRVQKKNIEGKHLVTENTLVFLPHCSVQLTNNFLWRNWSAERLARTILIANSFDRVHILNPSSELSKDGSYLTRLIDHVTEDLLNLRDCPVDDAFNDTSIHTFKRCSKLPVDFFELNPVEPVYMGVYASGCGFIEKCIMNGDN